METKTIFRNLSAITIFAIVFCGLGYGAYAFNKTNANIAFSFLIVPPLIIVFAYMLKNIIARKHLKTAIILRKIFSLPLFALAMTPGIALIWIVGAAFINFGLPFIENPFLVGVTVFSLVIIGIMLYLQRLKRG